MNWKHTIIKVVLFIVIIILAYLLYESIMRPLRFNSDVAEREKAVKERLIDLRNSQQMYKQLNQVYMGDFDTLIWFLDSAEIPIVNKIPDPNDTTFTLTINDTVGYVSVADSLFGKRRSTLLDSLRYIPYSGGEVFAMESGFIERGGIKVPVFEIKAAYKQFLKGLNEQMVINLVKAKKDIERYPGMKVGSIQEPSTDGNWE